MTAGDQFMNMFLEHYYKDLGRWMDMDSNQ